MALLTRLKTQKLGLTNSETLHDKLTNLAYEVSNKDKIETL